MPGHSQKHPLHRQAKTMRLFFALTFTLLLRHGCSAQPPYACDATDPSTKSLAFCKTDLPISSRAQDLVSLLTLEEKISQLVDSAPSIPRLGIPSYEWWSESLHGLSYHGKGTHLNSTIKNITAFPQVITTAASFNATLWYQIGQAIGTEARAVYNAGQANGMTFWAPNINIFRDPRWGRGQETPGEDPLVAGKYAVAYVRGLQGDSLQRQNLAQPLQASACCKHFTAYDLDNWNGTTRYIFDARVTQQDLADTYQPPFQSCVEKGRASGIMCAYNRVNGVPSCADFNLLTSTARQQWHFDGYITSDCDAVAIIYTDQKIVKTPEDAVVAVLNAGMDVDCGSYLLKHTKNAVEQKKLDVAQIDRALHNLFAVRMRLGLFDGDTTKLPFGQIGPDQVCSQDHQNIALDAARDGIVLLKNSARLLPLPKSNTISLAVIGPNADSPITLLGNYEGPPCKTITPLSGLQGYVKNAIYHSGCNAVNCTSAKIDEAVAIAKKADYVVLVMGLDQTQEREKQDRISLRLPGKQRQLISSVAKAAKKPVVLVLLSGGPVDITWAKYDRKIGGILWAGYPGGAGGLAVAEIIFGDHNPGGRLPVTWYPQEYTKVPMTDMRMRPEPSSGYPGRTYRFYTGRKVFDFGFGLSYSMHTCEFASVSTNKLDFSLSSSVEKVEHSDSAGYKLVTELGEELCKAKSFSVTVGVTNHGVMAGKHTVLLFVRKEKPRIGNPIKQLVGFESVKINGGEKAEVQFMLNPCEQFSSGNEEGLMVLDEGSHILLVGDVEYPIHVAF